MLGDVVPAFVARQHLGILVLEMFLWTKPTGRRVFGLSAEDAATTRTLAANQGLYNGFLAAGLVLSFFVADGRTFRIFFLSSVVVAGVFGGFTVSRRILLVQALPAPAR